MNNEMYSDGIGSIHFVGGMVRYDFVSIQPTEDGKSSSNKVVTRIVMSPQGFLSTFKSMQQLVDKLVEKGVLTKSEK